MKRLCYVATVPAAVLTFLRPHIERASSEYEITVVCDPTDHQLLKELPARLVLIPIHRKPSPMRDFVVLVRLWALFRSEHFDLVHSIMPKTGLIAMLAAWLARVPLRLHTFTGQVWATRRGWARWVLKSFDRMTALFATQVLVDGRSQRDFLIAEKVLSPSKASVIGAGSICGVDPDRFRPNMEKRLVLREALGIAPDAPLVLFLGRLNRDKGIYDLASAFEALAAAHPRAELLLVGAEEDVRFSTIQTRHPEVQHRLHHLPFTTTPEHYMATADILCLPSYREGFPLTIIEAGACAVPAVASNIYGVKDTIVDGTTGILVPPGDTSALAKALATLMSKALRERMGGAARDRVLQLFPSESITREMLALYNRLCGQR